MSVRRALAAAALLVLAARPAAADLSPAAQRQMDTGLTEYEQGRYSRAIEAFAAAYAIEPDPQLLIPWAQAERLSGQCDAAIPRYLRYLESRPGDDGVALATSGLQLCWRTQTARPVVVAGAEESSLPWYKNPISGAVTVGVIALGVGTGFLVTASGTRDEADHVPTSGEFERLLDQATTQRRVGAVMFAVGLGLVGGGIGYHYYTKRSAEPVATVSTDGRTVFVAGRF